MIAEAVVLAMVEDADAGLEPDDRRPAPMEFWDEFHRVMFGGLRISSADLDKLKGLKDNVVAGVMYVQPVAEEETEPVPAWVPLPFLSAQFSEDDHAANG